MLTSPSPVPSRRALRHLLADRSGASAIVIALSLTSLMGFAGLAVDANVWYSDKQAVQTVADAAAYSAAVDYMANSSVSHAQSTAKAVAAQAGLTDGTGGVTVTINAPPLSGTHTATTGAIEVVVRKSEPVWFSGLFLSSTSVAARAVGVAGTTGGSTAIGPYCMQALAGTGNSVNISNGVSISLTACGLQVASSSSSALSVVGGSTLTAKNLNVVGSYATNNGGNVNATNYTHATNVTDPYANRTVPSRSTCVASSPVTSGQYASGGVATLNPGTYCGLSIGNGMTVNLNPGVYVIDGSSGGTFSQQGGTTINATGGVTIVLTGSNGNYATANIANGATLNLTAPTTGATAGMAFFQDPQAPTSGSDIVAGGASMNITGAIYFPHQQVTFNNGSSTGSSCTQLIAYTLVFAGGVNLGNNCGSAGVSGIGATSGSSTQLVE